MDDNAGRKRNWEAYSIIVAMMVFIFTTIIDFSKNYFADLQSKDNVRIMLAYEINKNHQIMHFLDSTKNIGFDKNKEHLEGAPFPTDLNALGGVREGANKQVISSQADSLIKISRIWADFFPANTSNQPI
ncbi:hypothetical protein [Klebsiella quasipneumoniae]|uniref:hypothetical protein n=1 Tax=Klebsiella quasipneumoniae TaxID=1463165 RepID=UPI0025A1AC69|nr:hypothetical protein [Klebsiella quasipneumoniae]MDM7180757.1 hypothetical protein [Klebsiella quasipneumoniae subsp. similipneumoniae]MDM7303493.1 hypothetical protein [Klebsiella quasipneumoniae subsp. similipneumoniae]